MIEGVLWCVLVNLMLSYDDVLMTTVLVTTLKRYSDSIGLGLG